MADTKVTDLTSLATIGTTDELYIVDKSDTTDGSAGTSKRVAISELVGASTVTLTNKTIDADNNTVSNLAHGSEVDNLTTNHGATGAVVGTTNTQTLTNKTLTTPTITSGVAATSFDMNGTKLILDANANTSITADTDDQIDIEISGADDFRFTANKFEVLSGSNIDMNANELILDGDGDTSITADTEDQIDIRINNADDFKFTANVFEALSGSDILIANNESYQAKQAGGTAKDLIKLGTDDRLRLSQLNVQDDNADSVSNAADSLRENILIQAGWGQILGDGTDSVSETVTFPTAFGTVLSVTISLLGTAATTAASDVTGLTGNYPGGSGFSASVDSVTTTNFVARLSRYTGTFSNTIYLGYGWIAIGTKS